MASPSQCLPRYVYQANKTSAVLTPDLFPGLHLADVSVWICIAKAVAGLSIAPAVDEHGKPIDVVADVTDGLIC